jgi:hypothetical protein
VVLTRMTEDLPGVIAVRGDYPDSRIRIPLRRRARRACGPRFHDEQTLYRICERLAIRIPEGAVNSAYRDVLFSREQRWQVEVAYNDPRSRFET